MTNEQYFSDSPSVASAEQTVTLALPDCYVELITDRGVFSANRIDPGTKYLLTEAPLPDVAPKTALDLGCGYGPIAVTMGLRLPGCNVWAVDVNERARGLCERNAEALDLDISVAAPDGVPDDLQFDLIWSNPPIRVGKAALHELLLRWLSRLTPTGSATLVVQKHLGSDSLQAWLEQQGFATRRLSSRMGYRLLHIEPRP